MTTTLLHLSLTLSLTALLPQKSGHDINVSLSSVCSVWGTSALSITGQHKKKQGTPETMPSCSVFLSFLRRGWAAMLTCAERSSASSHTGLRPLVDGAACCISSASEASLSSVSARKAAGVRSSQARGCLSASHGNSACRYTFKFVKN